MSLFKAKEFWSFELDQLQHHEVDGGGEQTADFVAAVGRFSATGDETDVMVAGNLRGFVYLMQALGHVSSASEGGQAHSQAAPIGQRQLLAASKLDQPVVDLKCGYFTSALKQSLAVLSFDKLTVFQVNRRQVDLLSASVEQLSSSRSPSSGDQDEHALVDESLLSHEFVAHYSLDLNAAEMAQCLLVLDCHLDSALTEAKSAAAASRSDSPVARRGGAEGETSARGSGSFASHGSRQIVQQLHLPQRDKIVVQYSNQFLLTLIEYKKIVAHFELHLSEPREWNQQEEAAAAAAEELHESRAIQARQLEEASKNFASTPMAFLSGLKASSIVISLSNYHLYCVPLDKLHLSAKQQVVKRVALNLLQANNDQRPDGFDGPQLGRSALAAAHKFGGESERVAEIVQLNLSQVCLWTSQLVGQPIQMLGVQRRARDLSGQPSGAKVAMSGASGEISSQLLVMSRYQLDLFSNLGQHLWSLKFETPLVCFCAYTVGTLDRDKEETNSRTSRTLVERQHSKQFDDQLIALLCTDSLNNENRSNLIILRDQHIRWSALLGSRPLQVWRNCSRDKLAVSASLGTLALHQGLLTANYLGTNLDDEQTFADELSASDGRQTADECLSKLEQLDQDSFLEPASLNPPLFGRSDGQQNKETSALGSEANLLQLQTRLEATSEWPDVQVACALDILPAQNSSKVLHNITATLEFDDLLRLELVGQNNAPSQPISYPAQRGGFAQLRLGTCWPDRREAITIRANFSLASTTGRSVGAGAMTRLDERPQASVPAGSDQVAPAGLVPRSLEVVLYLHYNEQQSGANVQRETFLLPLSLLVNLAHLDYTSGQSQNLEDVLNNLGSIYMHPADNHHSMDSLQLEATRMRGQYHFCDMYLSLECSFMEFLEEFLESDLICRAKKQETISDESRRATTLENLNLLAQSLDCRLRYRNPTGLARQSSQDSSEPVMVSIALKLENSYSSLVERLASTQGAGARTPNDTLVWLHFCNMATPNGDTSLSEELFALHKLHAFDAKHIGPSGEKCPLAPGKSQLLISIESNQPIAAIFFQQHLIKRLECFAKSGRTLQLSPMMPSLVPSYRDLKELVQSGRCLCAVSPGLHDCLRSLATECNSKLKMSEQNLRDELAQECSKYQITITSSLALAKRLPDLSEEMVGQSQSLMALTRYYQSKLMGLIEDLNKNKSLEFEITKVPHMKGFNLMDEFGKSNSMQNTISS